MGRTNNDDTRDAERAYRATQVLYDIAFLFKNTTESRVRSGRFPVARSTFYNWRNGKSFYVTPYFLLLLDSLGYRLKLEKIGAEERQ